MSPSLPRSPFRRRIDPSLTPEEAKALVKEGYFDEDAPRGWVSRSGSEVRRGL